MMPISNWIPNVWSARFTRQLNRNLVYGNYVTGEYQDSEILQYGNVVKIPTYTKTFMVRDYVKTTPLSAPEEADGGSIDLNINKQKYFNFKVDDVDAAQSKPSIMDTNMSRAAFDMAKQIDADIKAEFVTGYADARNETVTGLYTAAGVPKLFLEALIEQSTAMDKIHLPAENRWAIVSPEIMNMLNRYFLTNPTSGVFVPAATEDTLRNGFRGSLLGFNVAVTPDPITATISSKMHHRVMLGQSNELVAHVRQINNVEAYRIEDSFADGVKGLAVYGTKAIEPTSLHFVSVRVQS